jgi:hypothetical protein
VVDLVNTTHEHRQGSQQEQKQALFNTSHLASGTFNSPLDPRFDFRRGQMLRVCVYLCAVFFFSSIALTLPTSPTAEFHHEPFFVDPPTLAPDSEFPAFGSDSFEQGVGASLFQFDESDEARSFSTSCATDIQKAIATCQGVDDFIVDPCLYSGSPFHLLGQQGNLVGPFPNLFGSPNSILRTSATCGTCANLAPLVSRATYNLNVTQLRPILDPIWSRFLGPNTAEIRYLHVAAPNLVSQMLSCQSTYAGNQTMIKACLSTPRLVDRVTQVAAGLLNTGHQCQWLQVQQRDQIRSGLAWLLAYETNTTSMAGCGCRTMVLDEIAVLRHRLNTMALHGTAWRAQCQETSSLGEFISNILKTTKLASCFLSEMQTKIDRYTVDIQRNATLAIQLAQGSARTFLSLTKTAIQSKLACLSSTSALVNSLDAPAEITALQTQFNLVLAAQTQVPAYFASQISSQFNATYALRLSEVNAIAPCPLAVVHDVMLSDIALLNQAARHGVQVPEEKGWLALFQVFAQQSMTKYIESKAFFDDVAKSTQHLLNTAVRFQRKTLAQATTLSQLANATIATWRQKLVVSEAARSTCWANRLNAFVSHYTNSVCAPAPVVPSMSSTQPKSWKGKFPCLFECDAVDPTLAWTPSQMCTHLSSSSTELHNGILNGNVAVRINSYNTHNVPAENLDRAKWATQVQIRNLANTLIAENNLKLGLGPAILTSYKTSVDALVFTLQHDVVNALHRQSRIWWAMAERVLVSTYQSYSCQPKVFLHPLQPESSNQNYAFVIWMSFRNNFEQWYNSNIWSLKSLYLKACRASLQSDLDVQHMASAANPVATSMAMATLQAQEMHQWQIIERDYIQQGFEYYSQKWIREIRAQIALHNAYVARRVPVPIGRNLTATELRINHLVELNALWSKKLNLYLNSTLEMMSKPCSAGQVANVTAAMATQQVQNLNSWIRNHKLLMINQKEGQLNLIQQSLDQMQAQMLVTSNLTLHAVLQARITSAKTQLPELCCQIETMIEEVLNNIRSKEERYWDEIDGVVDYQWSLWMTARTFNTYWVSKALNVTIPAPPLAEQCQRATLVYPLKIRANLYQPGCCKLCKLPVSGSRMRCSRSEVCPNGLCCSSAGVCANTAAACGEGMHLIFILLLVLISCFQKVRKRSDLSLN